MHQDHSETDNITPKPLDEMRNIRQHPDGWLASFKWQKKLYQKFFLHHKLENAKRWRDAMERSLYKEGRSRFPNLRTFKHPNCKTENKPLPIGASYNIRKKKLASGNFSEEFCVQLTYQVYLVHNERKVKNRRFYIGTVEGYEESMHQYALKTLHAFAEEYRYCALNQLPFYPRKYYGWKSKQLHLIPLKERALMPCPNHHAEKVHKGP
ncbi:MAG TPA: hypothetical protein ENK78_03150 [Thiothrix sp.]|nr:hypothetical protein [Thiothrix sp.]